MARKYTVRTKTKNFFVLDNCFGNEGFWLEI